MGHGLGALWVWAVLTDLSNLFLLIYLVIWVLLSFFSLKKHIFVSCWFIDWIIGDPRIEWVLGWLVWYIKLFVIIY